ncbi:MAG: tetratricopeptide repeat protein [candidate division Zixibacteria bacterium]|nr:tetratricopeptide repeat protein [candidate division Zixibacteria bacterium]
MSVRISKSHNFLCLAFILVAALVSMDLSRAGITGFKSDNLPSLSPSHKIGEESATLSPFDHFRRIMSIDILEIKRRLRARMRTSPLDSLPYIFMGDVLVSEGLLEESMVFFITALEVAPNYPLAHLAIGRAYHKLRDHQSAIAHYDTALYFNPAFRSALSMRALSKSLIDDWNGAITDFTRADSLRELIPEERYRLGICFWGAGETDRATIEFENTATLRPNDYRIFVSWSMAEASRGNLDDARRGLARAIQLAPNKFEVHEALCDMELMNENLDSAALHLERAVALRPGDIRLRNRLGILFSYLGEGEKSSEMFEISILFESRNPRTFAFWSQAQERLGNHQRALELIEEALKLAPGDAELNLLIKEISESKM